MNTVTTTQSILKITDRYLEFLDQLTEDQFSRSPSEGVWSYSEVYSHLFRANMGSLLAMEQCFHGTKTSAEKINWLGRLVLFFGRFPPVKLKAPAQLEGMAKKISLEEARNLVMGFRNKIAETAPKARKCSNKYKVRHPRLGMLTARQWLRFIEIHTKHHLKQLVNIRKLLINKRLT